MTTNKENRGTSKRSVELKELFVICKGFVDFYCFSFISDGNSGRRNYYGQDYRSCLPKSSLPDRMGDRSSL